MIEITITREQLDKAYAQGGDLGAIRNSQMKGNRNFVGFLGENAVEEYLPVKPKNCKDYDFVLEDGRTVDCKSAMINIPPRPLTNCNIMEVALHQKCDLYVFCFYVKPQTTLYICGYIPKQEYVSKARKVNKGDTDPVTGFNYRYSSRVLPMKELLPIEDLLCLNI